MSYQHRWQEAAERRRKEYGGKLLHHDGRTQSAEAWAKELGILPDTMYNRWGLFRLGMYTPEQLFAKRGMK